MKPPKRTCENCRFYRPVKDIEDKPGIGECRRFPPTVAMTSDFEGMGDWQQAFPMVESSDWCGEYRTQLKEAEGL